MEDQWIDICRTGTFRDRYGREVELTEEKFDRMVTQYDPEQRRAPAVIGHPHLNSPAYGWVSDLRRKGDRLQAKFGNVVHEFAEGVRRRMWPERSIKFDGEMNLVHVGFLGAAPPAVPGLAGIEFSEEGEGYEITYELADWRMPTVGELFRRIRDWILSEKDMETADRIIPPETLTELADRMDEVPEWYRQQMDDHERRLREMERKEKGTETPSELSTAMETETTTTTAAVTTANGAEAAPEKVAENGGSRTTQGNELHLHDRVRRLEEENAQLREKEAVNEFSSFLGSAEMSERVTPAMREGAVELFRVLRAGPVEFEFASWDDRNPVEYFKMWLRKLPKSIELGRDSRTEDRDEHELSGGADDVYAREGEAIARS